MKTFTCRDMGGSCDASFSGESADEVGKKGGEHIMSTTDDAHKAMRDQMAVSSEEDKATWWTKFREQFAAKSDD